MNSRQRTLRNRAVDARRRAQYNLFAAERRGADGQNAPPPERRIVVLEGLAPLAVGAWWAEWYPTGRRTIGLVWAAEMWPEAAGRLSWRHLPYGERGARYAVTCEIVGMPL